MFLEKSLAKFGLTEKQAKIYLALLELGTDSVKEIASKAEIKRPTTYLIIDELSKMGLIVENPSYKGVKYTAESPEKLKNILNEQKKELDYAFPFLDKIYNKEKEKPQVKVFEGLEAMRKVYIDYIFKSTTEVLFFSAIKKVGEMIPDLTKKWEKEISQKPGFKSKELLNPKKEDISYGLKVVKTSANFDIRVLPKESVHLFEDSDCAIFGDKVMFVSYGTLAFTTLIQSQLISKSLRALFFQAWEQAIPIEKFANLKQGQ